MPQKDPVKTFLTTYSQTYEEAGKKLSSSMEKLLEEVLAPTNVDIHQIKCRYKNPDSVRMKVYEKKYKYPKKQLTDALGARVITYYGDDVSVITAAIENEFEIDHKNSEDKKKRLEKTQFGYNSIHILARPKSKWVTQLKYPELSEQVVEIQIRTILQHTWAEIEHELVYKSGADYSDETYRQFARIAGTLEILELQFLQLKGEKDSLVTAVHEEFKKNKSANRKLDTAGMIITLEKLFPHNLGWRSAGNNFAPKSDLICYKALKALGIKDTEELKGLFKNRSIKSAIKKLEKNGEVITHYTIILIALSIDNKDILEAFFPTNQILKKLT